MITRANFGGRSVGCTYSRYADDLTFSTNKKEFPDDIAIPSGAEGTASHLWLPGKALQNVVKRTGFRINAKKTHLMYRDSRQTVTGLVVNNKINTRQEYRHNVRAMVHSLVKTGTFQILGVTHKDGQVVLEKRVGRLNELHGMLGFIDSINFYNRNHTRDIPPDKILSSEKVYREFLMYTMFYAAQMPVVICEGETDNIYLTHAIRSLAVEFPALAEVMPGGKIHLKIRLFKYPGTSTGRLLGLNDGGSSVLSIFIGRYASATTNFKGPGLAEPVVILHDNDDGAKTIRGAIKSVSKVMPSRDEPFVHIIKNLYAVPTPLGEKGKPSKIEDFFDASILATEINGKTFNPGNGFDRDSHYSKKFFARKVITPRADEVDFTGFRPLLRNLSAAINKHKASVVP